MRRHFNPKMVPAAVAFIVFAVTTCAGQTQIDVPDIAERSLVDNRLEPVERHGKHLVRIIRSRYRQRTFVYRFEVVNVRDLNAFARTMRGGN